MIEVYFLYTLFYILKKSIVKYTTEKSLKIV